MTVGPTTKLGRLVGSAAARLKRGRGLETVADLLQFRPRRYSTWTPDLSHLHEGMYAVVVATVKSGHRRSLRQRRGSMFEAVITDGTTDVHVAFFSAHGHDSALTPGTRAIFAGKVTRFRHQLQLAHPDYEVIGARETHDSALLPIYRRVPKVANWTVKRCVQSVLDVVDDWPQPVPTSIRERRGVLRDLDALRAIHLPDSFEQVATARHSLAYREAFLLQTALAMRRAAQAQDATIARPRRDDGLLTEFDRRLPWPLTEGQREVSDEIFADLAQPVPMHRLLQGEVGSGKTVVALRAMLSVVDSGGQAALLAPTEVLAGQHHASITAMMGPLADVGLFGDGGPATKVALLTGSMSAAARQATLLDVVTGQAGIVIGTHALIQESVKFDDLGLVVVDEQHRFGVEQRDALRAKATAPPHVLVMTATPIPRTVAMTVFGDMETSTLRQLPAGRAGISSFVVPESRPGWSSRTWARVAEEIAAGRQAYVVCPRIYEDPAAADDDGFAALTEQAERDDGFETWDPAEVASPSQPLHAVTTEVERLRALPELSGARIEALHGQLTSDEKDAVMSSFVAGEVDILVATTVIEVGVDVPNASVMVIEDADRFGVSQLHQLRGRVGRGEHPGLCLLMTCSENEDSLARLEAVASTSDGFELANLDLQQRREGDVLGAAQHGRSSLEFLSLIRDEDLIRQARDDAFELVDRDPALREHPDLAQAVRDRLEPEQAAYLERG